MIPKSFQLMKEEKAIEVMNRSRRQMTEDAKVENPIRIAHQKGLCND
jgi:hypothetical protein